MKNERLHTARLLRRAIITGSLFLAAIMLAVPSFADGKLSNRSVRGDWGFSALGTILPPALETATPAAAVGTIHFDGAGGCFFVDTVNIGGNAVSRSSTSCSYQLDGNALGTILVSFPGDMFPTPLSFVVVEGASEIRFIRTDLGVAEGVAKRIGDGDDDD